MAHDATAGSGPGDARAEAASGMRRQTAVPRPGVESTSRLPPAKAARSRMRDQAQMLAGRAGRCPGSKLRPSSISHTASSPPSSPRRQRQPARARVAQHVGQRLLRRRDRRPARSTAAGAAADPARRASRPAPSDRPCRQSAPAAPARGRPRRAAAAAGRARTAGRRAAAPRRWDAVVDRGGALVGAEARQLELHPQRGQALAEVVVQLGASRRRSPSSASRTRPASACTARASVAHPFDQRSLCSGHLEVARDVSDRRDEAGRERRVEEPDPEVLAWPDGVHRGPQPGDAIAHGASHVALATPSVHQPQRAPPISAAKLAAAGISSPWNGMARA